MMTFSFFPFKNPYKAFYIIFNIAVFYIGVNHQSMYYSLYQIYELSDAKRLSVQPEFVWFENGNLDRRKYKRPIKT